MGLKCVSIYRDGSKRSQPLNTTRVAGNGDGKNLAVQFAALQREVEQLRKQVGQPVRRRMPETRASFTHKFSIAGHEGYFTVGLFEDGRPGELFITMAKEGSTIGGLMDTVATLVSLSLQYGVPLEDLVRKFAHQRFEPSGYTLNPQIRVAKSIVDYIFRWLGIAFIADYESVEPETNPIARLKRPPQNGASSHGASMLVGAKASEIKSGGRETDPNAIGIRAVSATEVHYQSDAPPCHHCGAIMVRNGACYRCPSCGESSGCG